MNFLLKIAVVGFLALLGLMLSIGAIYAFGPGLIDSGVPGVETKDDGSIEANSSLILSRHQTGLNQVDSLTKTVKVEFDNGTTKQLTYKKTPSRIHVRLNVSKGQNSATSEAFKLVRKENQTSFQSRTESFAAPVPDAPSRPIQKRIKKYTPERLGGVPNEQESTEKYFWGEFGENNLETGPNGIIVKSTVKPEGALIETSVTNIGNTTIDKPQWVSDQY